MGIVLSHTSSGDDVVCMYSGFGDSASLNENLVSCGLVCICIARIL